MASLPGPQEKLLPVFSLFLPFTDPEKRTEEGGKAAAEARAHGAEPQSDRLLSGPASCRLREVVSPEGGGFVCAYLWILTGTKLRC